MTTADVRISFDIEIIDIENTDIEEMATHFRGTDIERRALDAYIKLMRSTVAVNAQLFPPLQAEFGVTASQLGVLEALSHLGPMPHCALAGKLLVSASNLTTVLDNLERDGLVRRDRDAGDRRVSIISLTAAGEARLASFFPQHVQRLVRAMSGLDEAEQAELGRLCRKLGLSATSRDSPPRVSPEGSSASSNTSTQVHS
ncbi:MAG: MarR family transcriptional regulator [Gemmatimonadaceae bacterium]|nr:MarR family transcriptional regulator [Gemmatimonadaceae bacterium]